MRYRGGTYSSTIHRIILADGAAARTDLVRLNPGVRAYSLDFDGKVAATPVTYRAAGPAHPHVASLVAASYPRVDLATLTARVRAAGHAIGAANIRDDEAIAATQAAIWHLTNGLHLHTTPRNTPVSVRARAGGDAVAALRSSHGITLDAGVVEGRPLNVDVDFAHRPVLASVSLDLDSSGPSDDLRLELFKATATGWAPVRGVRYTPTDGPQTLRLPPLATVSDSRHGVSQGHRRYRVAVSSASSEPLAVSVSGLRFGLSGESAFRNASNVVALYDYLLARVGQRRATPAHDAVVLVADGAPGLTPLIAAIPAAAGIAGDSLSVRATGSPRRPRTSLGTRAPRSGDARLPSV